METEIGNQNTVPSAGKWHAVVMRLPVTVILQIWVYALLRDAQALVHVRACGMCDACPHTGVRLSLRDFVAHTLTRPKAERGSHKVGKGPWSLWCCLWGGGWEGWGSGVEGQVQIESDLDTVSSLEPTPDEIEISQQRWLFNRRKRGEDVLPLPWQRFHVNK